MTGQAILNIGICLWTWQYTSDIVYNVRLEEVLVQLSCRQTDLEFHSLGINQDAQISPPPLHSEHSECYMMMEQSLSEKHGVIKFHLKPTEYSTFYNADILNIYNNYSKYQMKKI